MIKYSKLKEVLKGIKNGNNEEVFIEEYNIIAEQDIELPFGFYVVTDTDNVMADGVVYYSRLNVHLEILDEQHDQVLFNNIIYRLDEYGIPCNLSFGYDSQLRSYTYVADFDVENG